MTLTSEEAVAIGAAAIIGAILSTGTTGPEADKLVREAVDVAGGTTLTPTEIKDLGLRMIADATSGVVPDDLASYADDELKLLAMAAGGAGDPDLLRAAARELTRRGL